MKFDPLEVFLAILRIVPAIIIVVAALVFIFSFKVTVVTNELERTNIELAELVMISRLTSDRSVFDTAKLDAFVREATTAFPGPIGIATTGAAEPPNIESPDIGRNCKAASFIEIKDLQTAQTWSFGYQPAPKRESEPLISTALYDIAVTAASPSGSTVHPGRLTVTVRETWLSRFTCGIEEAAAFHEARPISMPCLFEGLEVEEDGKQIDYCVFIFGRAAAASEHLCLTRSQNLYVGQGLEIAECRHVPTPPPVVNARWLYPKSARNQQFVIYPLKEEQAFNMEQTQLEELCAGLTKNPDAIAGADDEVKSVIICLN